MLLLLMMMTNDLNLTKLMFLLIVNVVYACDDDKQVYSHKVLILVWCWCHRRIEETSEG